MDISEITPEVLANSPTGAVARFVKLTDTLGVKLFRWQNESISSMNRQKRASEEGLAPKVFDSVQMKIGDTDYFGYTTEIADVIPHSNKSGKMAGGRENWARIPCQLEDLIEESTDYQVLKDSLLDIGMGGDLHSGNIGWIENRMVCIDFSSHCITG